jgi:hypothetical protein
MSVTQPASKSGRLGLNFRIDVEAQQIKALVQGHEKKNQI